MKEDYWTDPERSFDGQYAAKLFAHFPLEEWCRSDVTARKSGRFLSSCALDRRPADAIVGRQRSAATKRQIFSNGTTNLGTMLARALPFFDLQWIREHFLQAVLRDDEEALRVLAEFADSTVKRHVLNAKDIPENALSALHDCVQRVIDDRHLRRKVIARGKSTATICRRSSRRFCL